MSVASGAIMVKSTTLASTVLVRVATGLLDRDWPVA
jgi:hypothetical protein